MADDRNDEKEGTVEEERAVGPAEGRELLDRRRFAKVLAAGGVAVASGLVRPRWEAPFVEFGTLAQAGAATYYPITLSDGRVERSMCRRSGYDAYTGLLTFELERAPGDPRAEFEHVVRVSVKHGGVFKRPTGAGQVTRVGSGLHYFEFTVGWVTYLYGIKTTIVETTSGPPLLQVEMHSCYY